MQLSVLKILLFSIIGLVGYYYVPQRYRKSFLALLSTIFYLQYSVKMYILALVCISGSWGLSFVIERAKGKCKNFFLFVGVVGIVGILIFCKIPGYYMPGENGDSIWANVVIPLGFSYYGLKIISYLVDIYMGRYGVVINFVSYYNCILFFPQIVSGPIERVDVMLRSMDQGMSFDEKMFGYGFERIITGMFKKMIISNRLSNYIEAVFSHPESYPAFALWMGAFFFTIQLYCDFSGYSDIAIGIAYMYGVDTTENFKFPFMAHNIAEFWERWHISLSSWLRDYVYIPLGGNRRGKLRKNINLMLTFLVSGLWHGNGIHYIVWGGWHGILRVLCHSKQSTNKQHARIWNIVNSMFTFLGVMFGFVFFRASSLEISFIYIKRMFSNLSFSLSDIIESILPFTMDYTCVAYFIVICFFIIVLGIKEFMEAPKNEKRVVFGKKWTFFCAVSIILFGMFGGKSFVYAQF